MCLITASRITRVVQTPLQLPPWRAPQLPQPVCQREHQIVVGAMMHGRRSMYVRHCLAGCLRHHLATLQGKSVVRVVPGVQQLGPHYWRGTPSARQGTCAVHSHNHSIFTYVRASDHISAQITLEVLASRWKSRSNPHGQWQTRVSEDALVLHYAYSYRSDVADKAAVSCPDAGYLAAARRGDRAKVLSSALFLCLSLGSCCVWTWQTSCASMPPDMGASRPLTTYLRRSRIAS